MRFTAVGLVLALSLVFSSVASLHAEENDAENKATADELHAALLLREQYPAARACAGCHPKHYKEWSISQHAYAQMSPIFNAMQGTVIKVMATFLLTVTWLKLSRWLPQ